MTAEAFEFVKSPGHGLVPFNERARVKINRLADGEVVLAVLRRPRNIGFHRKMLGLFRLAFNQWNPKGVEIEGMPAVKSFDVMRREITVAAGYYDVVLGLDGNARLEAQSLSVDSMDQETFEEVYEAVVSVLTAGILKGMSKEEAQRLADAVIEQGY